MKSRPNSPIAADGGDAGPRSAPCTKRCRPATRARARDIMRGLEGEPPRPNGADLRPAWGPVSLQWTNAISVSINETICLNSTSNASRQPRIGTDGLSATTTEMNSIIILVYKDSRSMSVQVGNQKRNEEILRYEAATAADDPSHANKAKGMEDLWSWPSRADYAVPPERPLSPPRGHAGAANPSRRHDVAASLPGADSGGGQQVTSITGLCVCAVPAGGWKPAGNTTVW